MNRQRKIWIVGLLPLLAGCWHAAMMGGMGVSAGMMSHRSGSACRRAASAMETQLPRTDTAGSEMLAASLPEHRRRLETLLDACAPRASDTSAGADSVRASLTALRDDLVRLGDFDAPALAAFMPEHRAHLDTLLRLLTPATHQEHTR